MGARGLNLALEGHPINILSPQSVSGGVSATVFGMRKAAKANILISFGAFPAAIGAITVSACDDASGANPVAIGYDVYKQETAGNVNDVLGARVAVPAAGYSPAVAANSMAVIHFQADQLPQGKPYVKLSIGAGAVATFASAVAVLTGLRYGGESNVTATA